MFDAVDVDLPYNAIIGRPALAQFMAVAHYAYLTLKIPRPQGIIKLHTDVKASAFRAERLYDARGPRTSGGAGALGRSHQD